MRSEVLTITKHEYMKYKNGENAPIINSYFKLILKELPKKLYDEAKQKGFILKEDCISMDILTLQVTVPEASKELRDAISSDLIFCYLD